MKDRLRRISFAILALAFVCVLFSFFVPRNRNGEKAVARRVERVLSVRLSSLDQNIEKAFSQDCNEWMNLPHLGSDMVVYRYVNSNLQSWAGRFPVLDDRLVPPTPASGTSRRTLRRPLAGLSSEYTYRKLSTDGAWLLKRQIRDSVTIVAGLDLSSSRKLVPEGYAVRSVQTANGVAVKAGGREVFKIVYESLPSDSPQPSFLLLTAFLLLCISLILLQIAEPRWSVSAASIAIVLGTLIALRWLRLPFGNDITSILVIFRINFFYFFAATSLFICRRNLWAKIKGKWPTILAVAADILAILSAFFMTGVEIYKVFVYTRINPDLTRLEIIGAGTAAVILSLLMLLLSVYLLFTLLQPLFTRLLRRKASLLSAPARVIFAIVLGGFLLLCGSVIGFHREEAIAASWAESLSNDRDNSVETILKKVERNIAGDEIVGRLSASSDNEQRLREYLLDNYLYRVLPRYDVSVRIGEDTEGMEGGVQIERNSRFLYAPLADQRSRYVGTFQYYVAEKGLGTVTVSIEPKASERGSSISFMLGLGGNGDEIPSLYSYAKYKGADRLYFSGSYVYPTRLSTKQRLSYFNSNGESHYTEGGYLHFVTRVTDDELIVISRKNIPWDRYLLAYAVFALLIFLFESLYSLRRRKAVLRSKNSIKKTITILIVVCLTLAMSVLVTFSISFVFNRNEANARSMMSDRTNSIRSLLQSGLRSHSSNDNLVSRETLELLHRVSDNTGSEITLFAPDGSLLLSTSRELVDRMLLGSRMNGTAFRHIMFLNEGYYIGKETYGKRKIYTMYAPILGSDGKIVTIFASPYLERNYDFMLDAITHTVSIVVVYIILLMVSLALVSYFVDKAFRPLSEMSRKMAAGDVDRLEYISYNRQDEISALVKSYNRMVSDLNASNRILAQAERDKAWSEMARSVAHEIKNPLTPMRLQIQRIQRLKAAGDPSWQDKFDDMSKVLLDQIEILSDTATQFSDFAKLYTEESVEIDLDSLLRDEVDLYDNRPDIRFEYLGLPGAIVHGPKPQIVRVFVNLLSNAVQACEGREGSIVSVSLRNGSNPDYYEMTFEDNGPGVAEENLSKLFTPKFTTKSSGSGLGLAISRNILERCRATISYSRSFSLGGACFTIRYPKG